jgi:hypothetical protein
MATHSWPSNQKFRYSFRRIVGDKRRWVTWECEAFSIEPDGTLIIKADDGVNTDPTPVWTYGPGDWIGPIYLYQIWDGAAWDDAEVETSLIGTAPLGPPL